MICRNTKDGCRTSFYVEFWIATILLRGNLLIIRFYFPKSIHHSCTIYGLFLWLIFQVTFWAQSILNITKWLHSMPYQIILPTVSIFQYSNVSWWYLVPARVLGHWHEAWVCSPRYDSPPLIYLSHMCMDRACAPGD